MKYDQTINWEDLPHERIVGHGVEGLVLRLGERECIKIYSPKSAHVSSEEFENYKLLRSRGFLVPEPKAYVKIHIGGKKVKLPAKCEARGIGLYTFSDLESVPGIVKEFFPGKPYGTKNPSIREMVGLLNFLGRLHSQGLTFKDGIIEDFISSDKGTALVDCSTLADRSSFGEKSEDFESSSFSYTNRILSDLDSNETRGSFGFWLKLNIAKMLAVKINGN